ncbi:unnamed protein product [Closterium sp. NIES-64]|nr:unnamed protein product [Closterium sp. NIES-64]
MACRAITQPVSASPCERNWAKFDAVHTARRNRLGAVKLRDLVYVTHNWQVVHNWNKAPEGLGVVKGNIEDPPTPAGYNVPVSVRQAHGGWVGAVHSGRKVEKDTPPRLPFPPNPLLPALARARYLSMQGKRMGGGYLSVRGKRMGRRVLFIAEDYHSFRLLNRQFPMQTALIVTPKGDQTAGIEDRRPWHFLRLLQHNVSFLYNDPDMVWLQLPFGYFNGDFDLWTASSAPTFDAPQQPTDDAAPTTTNHHLLRPTPLPPNQPLSTALLYFRASPGARAAVQAWQAELKFIVMKTRKLGVPMNQSEGAFNRAVRGVGSAARVALLPQLLFPSTALYFRCGWEVWLGGVAGRCGWEVRLGGAAGRCGWEVWLGGVAGRCGWEVRLGGAAGRCGWEVRLGGVGGRCGWEVWLGGVAGRCGWEVWLGGVAGRCGWEVWLGGVAGRCGWEVRLGGAAGRCGWEVWLGGVAGRCGWEVRLGGAAGRCGWEVRLGGVAGRCGWEVWLGGVAGWCGWEVWLGGVAGRCGWEVWLGGVAGRCGWEVWLGGVAGRCGWEVWLGGVAGRCGWEVWLGGVAGRCGWEVWLGGVAGRCDWEVWQWFLWWFLVLLALFPFALQF